MDKAKNLSPHHNIVDVGYYKINKNLYLSPTTVLNISNYIMSDDEEEDPECPIYQELLDLK